MNASRHFSMLERIRANPMERIQASPMERIQASQASPMERMEVCQAKPAEPRDPKKIKIPSKVRADVWATYIGSHIAEHKCICCKRVTIKQTDFEVGHVQSEAQGGTLEINNLRPICSTCNKSMGRTNMVEFVKKYGYFI